MAALVLVKDHPMYTIYEDGYMMLKSVRVSFPHLEQPFAGKDDNGNPTKPKYGIVGMICKKTQMPLAKAVSEAIAAMTTALKTTVAKEKRFFRNGDDGDREEYLGHYTVSARETKKPSLRDRRGHVISPEEAGELIYGGCYCNVLIRMWFQDGQKVGKGFGKRVNAGLVGVQFVRDGESFGEGRINDDDAWGAVEGEDGSDAFDDNDEL